MEPDHPSGMHLSCLQLLRHEMQRLVPTLLKPHQAHQTLQYQFHQMLQGIEQPQLALHHGTSISCQHFLRMQLIESLHKHSREYLRYPALLCRRRLLRQQLQVKVFYSSTSTAIYNSFDLICI